MADEYILKQDGIAIGRYPTAEVALQGLLEMSHNDMIYGRRHKYTIERDPTEQFTERDKDFLTAMHVSLDGDNR